MDDATPTSVYQYFDVYGSLIYVGITARGAKRQAEHNKTKTWWAYVDHQSVEHFDTRSEALARESALIVERRPPFNTQQNPTHAAEFANYDLLRQIMATSDVTAMAQECRRELPLTMIRRTTDRVELLTPLGMAPVALRVTLAGQPKGVVGTTKCGMVTDLGPRSAGQIVIGMRVRAGFRISEPFARLKMITTREGPAFSLRNVQLAP